MKVRFSKLALAELDAILAVYERTIPARRHVSRRACAELSIESRNSPKVHKRRRNGPVFDVCRSYATST